MSLFEITHSINAAARSLPDAGKLNNSERMALLAACDKLKAVPVETVLRIIFAILLSRMSIASEPETFTQPNVMSSY